MIQKIISLVIALFIQLFIIHYMFGIIKFDRTDYKYKEKNKLKNIAELFIMIILSSIIIYYFLRKTMDKVSIKLIILLTCSLILLYWLVYKTDYLSYYISRVYYGDNGNGNGNVANGNVDIIDKKKNNVQKVIFSKYHNPDNNRDFSFEDTYPDYNDIPNKPTGSSSSSSSNSSSSGKDYSMYNGYDKSNICYKCKCITKDDGSKYCGKKIKGLGSIGCSERWNCHNCKDCQEWDDKLFGSNSKSKQSKKKNSPYTCKDCKCLNTDAGTICGRVSRVDGFVKKCNTNCPKCDKCYGFRNSSNRENNNNAIKYIDVKPESNLDRVIVNTIMYSDLNDIVD